MAKQRLIWEEKSDVVSHYLLARSSDVYMFDLARKNASLFQTSLSLCFLFLSLSLPLLANTARSLDK